MQIYLQSLDPTFDYIDLPNAAMQIGSEQRAGARRFVDFDEPLVN